MRLLRLKSLFSEKSELLDDDYDKSYCAFLTLFLFIVSLAPRFLYLLSSDGSNSLDDESDNDWYYSGSSGTCDFPFHFEKSVGRDSFLGSGVFVPIRVKSKYDVFAFVMYVLIGVESKVGRLIQIFWPSNY